MIGGRCRMQEYDMPYFLYYFPVLRLGYDIQWTVRFALCQINVFRYCESISDGFFVVLMNLASKLS